mgnify:CR=1 FL=1
MGALATIRYHCANLTGIELPLKALFDFLPVVAFFVAYMAFGRDIYLATKVTMAATLLQMVFLRVRRLPITFTNIAVAVMVWGLGRPDARPAQPALHQVEADRCVLALRRVLHRQPVHRRKPLLERALSHAAGARSAKLAAASAGCGPCSFCSSAR